MASCTLPCLSSSAEYRHANAHSGNGRYWHLSHYGLSWASLPLLLHSCLVFEQKRCTYSIVHLQGLCKRAYLLFFLQAIAQVQRIDFKGWLRAYGFEE
jgi:hypothetical protein